MATRQIIKTVDSIVLGDIESIVIERDTQDPSNVVARVRYRMRESSTNRTHERAERDVNLTVGDRGTLKNWIVNTLLPQLNTDLGF